MQWWDNILDFFKSCDAGDLAMLGALILIPILAVILLIVSIAKASGRRKNAAREAAAEPAAETTAVPVAAPEPVAQAPAPAPVAEQPCRQQVVCYQPGPVQPAERVKVKVRVTNLKKADKYLLMATGAFCIGLGIMIQRAMSKD